MIIWTRWGILVILIAAVCFVSMELLVREIFQDHKYYQEHGWPKALASWLSAAILWPLGLRMNRTEIRQMVDFQTGQVVNLESGGGHDLFFIPMQYWGVIFAVLGPVLLFTSKQI
jgi:hypothetical protein